MNTPDLFYQNYSVIGSTVFGEAYTTNPLEAEVFSQLKNKINIHAGMGKSLKLKMVDEFLLNYKKK
jgi:hypothetical protein